MNEQIKERMDECMNGQMDGRNGWWKDRWVYRRTDNANEWMNAWTDWRKDGQMDGFIVYSKYIKKRHYKAIWFFIILTLRIKFTQTVRKFGWWLRVTCITYSGKSKGESSNPTRSLSLSLSPSLLPPSTTMSELAVDVAEVHAVFEALPLQNKSFLMRSVIYLPNAYYEKCKFWMKT